MLHINKPWAAIGALLIIFCVQNVSATSCDNRNAAIEPSTPDADFAINDNGTAIHRKTGLMWMRCPLGYELDTEENCVENPDADLVFTWQEALEAAEELEYGHFDDWRLPDRNELESIVEQACWESSINSKVFPDTPWGPEVAFWSSSPSVSDGANAWRVSFISGLVSDNLKSTGYHVRLVRGGK